MKRIFLRLSIVLSAFIVFTSCESRIDYYPDETEYVFDDVSEIIIETSTDTTPPSDEPIPIINAPPPSPTPLPPLPTNSHPLAMALWNYMAGNIVIYHPYHSVRISSEIRFAELVTLDEIGTIGVLIAIDDNLVSRVLLYIYNDELFYSFQGWSGDGAFGAGRYNRLMSDWHGFAHIYTLESGRLVISTSWFDPDVDGHDASPRFNDRVVTEDELNTLVERASARYGINGNWVAWVDRFDRDDQTKQILAMTINCVPSLAKNTKQRTV